MNYYSLFKTEVINYEGPWRTFADVEYATLVWVDWYNRERLHSAIGNVPPLEYEQAYYEQLSESDIAA